MKPLDSLIALAFEDKTLSSELVAHRVISDAEPWGCLAIHRPDRGDSEAWHGADMELARYRGRPVGHRHSAGPNPRTSPPRTGGTPAGRSPPEGSPAHRPHRQLGTAPAQPQPHLVGGNVPHLWPRSPPWPPHPGRSDVGPDRRRFSPMAISPGHGLFGWPAPQPGGHDCAARWRTAGGATVGSSPAQRIRGDRRSCGHPHRHHRP